MGREGEVGAGQGGSRAEEMCKAAGRLDGAAPSTVATPHSSDLRRCGLQMCQLGGRGREERVVSRHRLPPGALLRTKSPFQASSLPALGLQSVPGEYLWLSDTLLAGGPLEACEDPGAP